MPRHPVTIDDLWALPRVGSPAPSPDGTFLIVPVTTYSMESDKGTTRLFHVPSDGGTPRALTADTASSTQPAVSPDGQWLAFARKVTKKDEAGAGHEGAERSQVFRMPLDGGEAEQLTDLPLGASHPLWFPDGRTLAFLAPVYLDAPSVEGTAALAKDRAEDKVTARVTENRVYRYWDRWLTDGDVHHVFALDLASRRITDLTPGLTGWMPFMDASGHYAIAPDGREIALTAIRSDPPYDPLVYGVYTAAVPEHLDGDAAPGALRLLAEDHPANAVRPAYSPDGRWLIYGIQREIDFYADRQRVVAYDRAAGTHTVLTEAWDVNSASQWTFGADPDVIVFTAEIEARTALLSLDLPSAVEDPAANPPVEIARGGTFSAPTVAGDRIFTTLQSLRQPPEVVSLALDGTDLRSVTDFTGPQMADLELSEVEEITFEGAGGAPVQMFVLYPPGIEPPAPGERPAEPWPLVHQVHGGPHGVFGDAWHWRWSSQAFAAPGYLVALVNFHGSTGWGQGFAASILGRWGDQPYEDVMAATDTLIERGLADPARMAVTGGSYGGYLVSWIASQTDRFACIVNHAGVCDFQTQFASDVTQGRRRSMGGELWDDIEGLDRYNPLRHAAGFRSPMLVLHGERDYRVPYVQGLEIYNVYKAMGLPARLVCYSDENHWILKPNNSRHWYGEVIGWLDRWLGGS